MPYGILFRSKHHKVPGAIGLARRIGKRVKIPHGTATVKEEFRLKMSLCGYSMGRRAGAKTPKPGDLPCDSNCRNLGRSHTSDGRNEGVVSNERRIAALWFVRPFLRKT